MTELSGLLGYDRSDIVTIQNDVKTLALGRSLVTLKHAVSWISGVEFASMVSGFVVRSKTP